MENTKSSGISENGGVQEQSKQARDGSICGYDSLHRLLRENLKPEVFQVILLCSSAGGKFANLE